MASPHDLPDPLRPAPLAALPPDLAGLSQGFLPRLPAFGWDTGAPAAAPGRPGEEPADDLNSFCTAVLSSIPRSDQRRWGRFYVRGLLATPGRKTVTRIVQTLSAPPADQGLQQFVNQSPWDWQPVRRDLAAVVAQVVRPEAWVVQPVFFPKSGEQSVAVTRQYVPPLAKLVNCQAAVSLWLAGDEASSPVEWRLVLPAAWANDARRRRQVGLPADAVAEEQWEAAVQLANGLAHRLEIPQRPLVLDFRHVRPGPALSRLQERWAPFVARVDASSVVWPAPRLEPVPGRGGSAALLSLATVAVRPDGRLEAVPWPGPLHAPAGPPGPPRALSLAGQPARRADRPLLLLAERSAGETAPGSLWVTSLVGAPLPDLARLIELGQRTAAALEGMTDLGLTDFEGRSYRGWHHHVTLVSVAHAYKVARMAAVLRSSRAG
jgi:hypothetical protein